MTKPTTMVRWSGAGWYAGACTSGAWVEGVDYEWIGPSSLDSVQANENARSSGLGSPVHFASKAEAEAFEEKCNS